MSASSGVVDLVTLLGRALPAAALDKHHLSLLLGYHSHLSRVNRGNNFLLSSLF